MANKNLILFTTNFPFSGPGYETFIETEIQSLSEAFEKVIIYPQHTDGVCYQNLPQNIEIKDLKINNAVSVKKSLKQHFGLILSYYFGEIFRSPKRWKYISQFKWNFYRLLGLIRDAEILKEELNQFELENTVFYSYWFDDWVSRFLLAKRMGFSGEIISRVHLFDFEEEYFSRGYIPFRYVESQHVNSIVPISDYAGKYMQSRYGNIKLKRTSRLGVASGGFNAGGDGDVYTIVSCSTLNWFKRPMLLLETVSKLPLKVKWYHFGTGQLKDEFLDKAKNLPDNIDFHYMGNIPNSEIYSFYANTPVDLLLNVSRFEGIPVSMMEAIGFGIPIVGCEVCGIPEIVTAETGLLLPVNFNLDHINHITSFLREKSRNIEFRNGVQSFWNENFNSQINYQQFIKNVLKN